MQIFFNGVKSCKRIFSGDFLNNFFFSSWLYFGNTASDTNNRQNASIHCVHGGEGFWSITSYWKLSCRETEVLRGF